MKAKDSWRFNEAVMRSRLQKAVALIALAIVLLTSVGTEAKAASKSTKEPKTKTTKVTIRPPQTEPPRQAPNYAKWSAETIMLNQTAKNKAKVCKMSLSLGDQCGPPLERWYYNPATESCERFTYLGCFGNPNNFPTEDYCMKFCGAFTCPFGGQPYAPEGQLPRRCGIGTLQCPSNYECAPVDVEGVQRLGYCCPSRSLICRQPPVQGYQCTNRTERFYYNHVTNRCHSFSYLGCGGNDNNFQTVWQCNFACLAKVCKLGENGNVENRAYVTCNSSDPKACSSGYTCRKDPFIPDHGICCGSTAASRCPTGSQALLDPVTNYTIKACKPNHPYSCGVGFSCTLGRENTGYFCCRATPAAFCPYNQTVFYDPHSRHAMPCLMNNPVNSCPFGYTCASAIANAMEGYCCSSQTTPATCPKKSQAYLDPYTQQPLACAVGQQCPVPGFACEVKSGLPTGYCCQISDLCPEDSTLINTPTGIPQACMVNGPVDECAEGECIAFERAGLKTHQGFCCKRPVNHAVCGANMRPYMRTVITNVTLPEECNPVNPMFSCAIGYSCQYSIQHRKYYCCTLDIGCKDNSYVDIDENFGTVISCSKENKTCRAGFECSSGKGAAKGQMICCSGDDKKPSKTTGAPGNEKGKGGEATTANPQDDVEKRTKRTVPTDPTTEEPTTTPIPTTTEATEPPLTDIPEPTEETEPTEPTEEMETTTMSLDYEEEEALPLPVLIYKGGKEDRVEQERSCPNGLPPLKFNNGKDLFCSQPFHCPPDHECTSVGAVNVCCPTAEIDEIIVAESICDLEVDVGQTCPSGKPGIRWYFENDRCKLFFYQGCGGNLNNYYDADQCLETCHLGRKRKR